MPLIVALIGAVTGVGSAILAWAAASITKRALLVTTALALITTAIGLLAAQLVTELNSMVISFPIDALGAMGHIFPTNTLTVFAFITTIKLGKLSLEYIVGTVDRLSEA